MGGRLLISDGTCSLASGQVTSPVMGSPATFNYFRPVSNVARRLKPSRATARQALPCNTAVARLGFKRRAPPCRTQFINYKYIAI